MAVDGPRDDDALSDALRWSETRAERGHTPDIDRFGARLELRNRSECHDELRGYHATESRAAARDAADAPERTDDGGWKWKGLELDPAANRIADEGIVARREAEGRDAEGNYAKGGITPVMRRIEAELEHGSLVPDTEKFALKSPDRFKEKLAKLIERRPGESVADLTAGIHDGIRYTFIFDADRYTGGVQAANAMLQDRGCELDRLANRWTGDEYKGINSRWRHVETEQFFEVQFHTQESWEVKQAMHDAYEKINDPTTDIEVVESLRAYQRGVARSLTMPDRCQDIEDYQQRGS